LLCFHPTKRWGCISPSRKRQPGKIWLLAETGLCPGELAGLKKSGIDWKRSTFNIDQSVWQGKIQTPKSLKAHRTFAISQALLKMLRGYLDHHWRTNSLGLVFANKRGNPMCMDDFRNRELNPILRKLGIDVKLVELGIKRCGNYAFRHMNATTMDEMDRPLKTRQHRLGHANPETTMRHCTHKVDADDRRVAEVIGAMLSPTTEAIM
jgi:integrase